MATSRSPGPSPLGQCLSSTEYATHDTAAASSSRRRAEAHRQQVRRSPLAMTNSTPASASTARTIAGGHALVQQPRARRWRWRSAWRHRSARCWWRWCVCPPWYTQAPQIHMPSAPSTSNASIRGAAPPRCATGRAQRQGSSSSAASAPAAEGQRMRRDHAFGGARDQVVGRPQRRHHPQQHPGPAGAGGVTASRRHGLAHADGAARRPRRVEAQRAGREQQHHGGAEQEAAHLGALRARRTAAVIGPLAHRPGRGGLTTPCHTVAMLPTMVAPTSTSTKGRAAVAPSNTQTTRSLRANSPGTPRAVVGLTENSAPGTWIMRAAAGAGHVDAVVVARAEVQRGEVAAVEVRGQRGVAADQRGGAVVVALGLEDALAVERAELADGAVHRAQPGGVGQRPRTGLQRAREEVVEGGVGADVGSAASAMFTP
jgi:hypothetical protein